LLQTYFDLFQFYTPQKGIIYDIKSVQNGALRTKKHLLKDPFFIVRLLRNLAGNVIRLLNWSSRHKKGPHLDINQQSERSRGKKLWAIMSNRGLHLLLSALSAFHFIINAEKKSSAL